LNRKDAETRAVFEAATKDLRNWFASHTGLPKADVEVQSALIEEMDGLRYASSLRASVNLGGHWHNFDYWHGLGFGTRREAVARAMKQVEELKVLIAAALRDQDLSTAHDFIKHFSNELETSVGAYYQWTQTLGEGAFQNQLGEDSEYWRKCQGRWGGGPGYKTAISGWTSSWFDAESSKERSEFVEAELQRQWKELFRKLDTQFSSLDPQAADADGQAVAVA